jgi:uncharacterized membrane protein YqjE
MFKTLRKYKELSTIVLDRLGDYLALLRIELKIRGREIRIRLLSYAAAMLLMFLAAVFFGIAIIVTCWDTEYRTLAAWAIVLFYIAAAAIGFAIGSRHVISGSPFTTLSNELRRDAEAIRESL